MQPASMRINNIHPNNKGMFVVPVKVVQELPQQENWGGITLKMVSIIANKLFLDIDYVYMGGIGPEIRAYRLDTMTKAIPPSYALHLMRGKPSCLELNGKGITSRETLEIDMSGCERGSTVTIHYQDNNGANKLFKVELK